MPSNTTLNAGSAGDIAVTRQVTHDGDTAKLQGVELFQTAGSEDAYTLTQVDVSGKVGSLTETAPATDTASSGLNGRLQRIAQRVTSLISQLPAALVGGRLDVNIGATAVTQPVSGTVTANAGTGTMLVDSELPAAIALADNAANPTAPAVGAFNLLWDGATWDRFPGTSADGALVNLGANNDVTVTGSVDTELPVAAALADATANPTTPLAGSATEVFNGTTWDRARGDITNGLDVDVTRLPALVAGAANIGDVDIASFAAGAITEVHGDVAHAVAVAGNPVLNGFEARVADGTAVSVGNAVRGQADTLGKQVALIGSVHDRHLNGRVALTTTTAADVIAAQGAGVRTVVMGYSITNSHATVSTKVELRDGTTVRVIDHAQAAGGGVSRQGATPIFIGTANTAISARAVTTGADVEVNISAYGIAN